MDPDKYRLSCTCTCIQYIEETKNEKKVKIIQLWN